MMVTRRRRRVSPLSAFYVVVTLALMVGGSLWLDYRSDPVPATVSGKSEAIQLSFDPQGGWYRSYRVGVEFTTADNMSGAATVEVSQERFDRLALGDTLAIRYLAAVPFFARTVDRSTMTVLSDLGRRVLSDQVLGPLLLWLGAGVIVLWVASRVSASAILVAGLLWIAASFPLLFPPPRPIRLPSGETSARVAAISLVDRAPARNTGRRRYGSSIRHLNVPYQVVQLHVPLPGRTDSVLAVDAVDSGSAPGLAHGAVLPVRLDATAPRDARLAVGTRTFMTRNRYHYLVPMVGTGLLAMLAAWAWHDRRRKRAPRNA